MVALAKDYRLSPRSFPANFCADRIFRQPPARIGIGVSTSRTITWENRLFIYDVCLSPSLAQSTQELSPEQRIDRLQKYASNLRRKVADGKISALEAGARLADYAALPHIGNGRFGSDNVHRFVTDLSAVGSGSSWYGLPNRDDLRVFMGVDSGFSIDLADGSDQVRHFLANVALGYTGGSFAIPLSDAREYWFSNNDMKDYDLNAFGVLAGRNLRTGETQITDFGDWMRINLGP